MNTSHPRQVAKENRMSSHKCPAWLNRLLFGPVSYPFAIGYLIGHVTAVIAVLTALELRSARLAANQTLTQPTEAALPADRETARPATEALPAE